MLGDKNFFSQYGIEISEFGYDLSYGIQTSDMIFEKKTYKTGTSHTPNFQLSLLKREKGHGQRY